MRSLPEDQRLADVARSLARTGWAAAICDADWRLVWVSDDLKILLGETDEERIGYGLHLLECYVGDVWSRSTTFESQKRAFAAQGPNFIADMGKEALIQMMMGSIDTVAQSPEEIIEFAQMTQEMEAADPVPSVLTYSFEYLQEDLPPMEVAVAETRLRDDRGETIGHTIVYSTALPARVLALVARGNVGMFLRMARLVKPGRRRAAILFADMQASSSLSKRLPSAAYFRLIREVTTAMDEIVVAHKGIVGKHAGDGVSAFFVEDDAGSASAAARAAIECAREIAEEAGRAAKEIAQETGLFEGSECSINSGVHWGGTLYMGQLVTGGRLEVTALGDEVNECARIEQAARDGRALASKTLIEHLTEEDAFDLGLAPDSLVYRTIADLAGAPDKSVRDAGGIAVTEL